MDSSKTASRWAWVPAVMPNVARLMLDKRKAHGDAWVNQCWQKGVVEGQPGWFFAREGQVAIGMPWEAFADVALWQCMATQGLLIIRTPEGAAGA